MRFRDDDFIAIISLSEFVYLDPIGNKSALVQGMNLSRATNNRLPEPMMTHSAYHAPLGISESINIQVNTRGLSYR